MALIDDFLENTEEKMMDAVNAVEHDFEGYRTGKASTALVENMMINYYGSSTRLRDIAGITTPESRLIVIQPWDQNALHDIEKAIQTSALGISPINDGKIIRLPVPELTEERRIDLSKQAKKRAEEAKVEVRNQRRDANDEAKKAQKSSEITEDELKELYDDVQKLTNDYIGKISQLTEKKEKEIMKI
jgi:ribosome recycling factor